MRALAGPLLAADLGGTKTTAGLVHADGSITGKRTIDTPAGPQAVIADLVGLLESIRTEAAGPGGPAAVGIGSAGVIDPWTGQVTASTDAIADWTGTQLGGRVARALGLGCHVLNDVHAHGLGEATFGAGATRASMLLVAVGTGIGGAMVRDGQVVIGHRAGAGQVGHLSVPEADSLPCPCGRRGHLEGLAAGPGVLAAYERSGGRAGDAREVAARAEAGDHRARRVLRTSAYATGRVIGGLLNVADPEVVVVTGGMSGAGPLWWNALREGVAHDAVDLTAGTDVRSASAGADAALLGAAQFARTGPQ